MKGFCSPVILEQDFFFLKVVLLLFDKLANQALQRNRTYIFSTHIFQPPIGLLMPVRERAEKRRVCEREKMTIKERRAWLLGVCVRQ